MGDDSLFSLLLPPLGHSAEVDVLQVLEPLEVRYLLCTRSCAWVIAGTQLGVAAGWLAQGLVRWGAVCRDGPRCNPRLQPHGAVGAHNVTPAVGSVRCSPRSPPFQSASGRDS